MTSDEKEIRKCMEIIGESLYPKPPKNKWVLPQGVEPIYPVREKTPVP